MGDESVGIMDIGVDLGREKLEIFSLHESEPERIRNVGGDRELILYPFLYRIILQLGHR